MKIPLIINKTQLAKELNISKQLLEYRIKKGLSEVDRNNIATVIEKEFRQLVEPIVKEIRK